MTRLRCVACFTFVIAGFIAIVALAGPTPVPSGPPAAPKQPVVDKYFGVSVTDDYRWLEDWNNNFVKSWSEVQNRFARRFFATASSAPPPSASGSGSSRAAPRPSTTTSRCAAARCSR